MTHLHNYEGDSDQIHGNLFAGEPISRSYEPVLPTPEDKIGGNALESDGSAAHVEPLAQGDPASSAETYGHPATGDVSVEFI